MNAAMAVATMSQPSAARDLAAGPLNLPVRGHDHSMPVSMFENKPQRCPFGHPALAWQVSR